MAKITLGEELIPALNELSDMLDKYGGVTQQQLIECLAARHAIRLMATDSPVLRGKDVYWVVDMMAKHIKQLVQR